MSAKESGLSGEDRLIAKYFQPLATHPGAMGLRDDAAYFTPPDGCDLVITKDAIVGGVHFLPSDPADKVARKALRVNLSDLAAKGADPAGFLLALALPTETNEDWLRDFSTGLADDTAAFGIPLLGGDTVRSPGPLMVSITALGILPRGAMVHRSGAAPGDHLFVSGTIGDAALGLRLHRDRAWEAAAQSADRAFLVDRYLLPQARNALAAAVRAHVSAAIDISDGLAGDLGKLCHASGVSTEVEVARVPLSAAAARLIAADPALQELALTGGDDYEVLCAVAPEKVAAFVAAATGAGVPVTEIGRASAGTDNPRFVAPDGATTQFKQGSFSHF